MNWTIIITIASIIGTVANIYRKRWCFAVWLCTNAFWFAYDAYHGLWSQALLFAVYFGLSVHGLVKWTKEAKKDAAKEKV